MTIAVCVNCGMIKYRGALSACECCSFVPKSERDVVDSLALTENYFSREELYSICADLGLNGTRPQLPADAEKAFRAAAREFINHFDLAPVSDWPSSSINMNGQKETDGVSAHPETLKDYDIDLPVISYSSNDESPNWWDRNGRAVTKSSVIGVALVGLGWAIFRDRPDNPVAVGWDDLRFCSHITSIDGLKHAFLYPNNFARVWGWDDTQKHTGMNRDYPQSGKWAFDETAKQYSFSFDSRNGPFTLIRPEGDSTCVLVAGNLAAADMRRSWVSSTMDLTDSEDFPREE